MKNIWSLTLLLCALTLVSVACKKSPTKRVFFVSPHDGDTVPPTFQVTFGVEGMTVRPAGEDAEDKTSGHHHLLVDNDKGYIDEAEVVPKDDKNIHYGKGETETTLTLSPGKHKLSMQLADGAHRSYGKQMSTSITVTVEPAKSGN